MQLNIYVISNEVFPNSLQVRVIPLELQRLFASLLLVDQQSASTASLTDSFGWNSSEVCVHYLSHCGSGYISYISD